MKSQDTLHQLRVSLITVDPGKELYSIFGHSAIRIVDSTEQTDLSYNYGTFDFNTPNFYPKFLRGKLLYILSVAPFSNFLQEYQYEQRSVSEQVIDMTSKEKNDLRKSLKTNALMENRGYKYDFFYDNCATRIKDKFIENSGSTINFGEADNFSFRTLLHQYLGQMQWSKFGIDLIIGSRADQIATQEEQMFLPDYLQKYFAQATVDSSTKYLFEPSKEILFFEAEPGEIIEKSFFSHPFTVFTSFGLVILLMSFLIKKPIAFIIANAVFAILGLASIIIAFMWFGTDHLATKANYNLIWLSPVFLLIPFIQGRYARYLLAILGILTVFALTPIFPQKTPALTLLPLIFCCIVAYIKNYPEEEQRLDV
ncbi:MAG TPA: DUF4105 domain-containing protein [Saprospiraceae bacterium]|nr:DUF4105 domain-containing protein [Saprospiraceae bacterium]